MYVMYLNFSLSIPSTFEIPDECIDLKNAEIIQLSETFGLNPNTNNPIILAMYSARYEEVLDFGIHRLKKEMR